jgi:hypothetical protein
MPSKPSSSRQTTEDTYHITGRSHLSHTRPSPTSPAPSKHGPHPISCAQHSPLPPRLCEPSRTPAYDPDIRPFMHSGKPHPHTRAHGTTHAADHRTAPHRTAPAPEGTTLNIRTGIRTPERRTRAARRHGCATPSQPDGHCITPPTSTCCPTRLVARLVRGKARHCSAARRRAGWLPACLPGGVVRSQPALWHSLIGGWRWCGVNAALRRVCTSRRLRLGGGVGVECGVGIVHITYIYLRLGGHEIEVSS